MRGFSFAVKIIKITAAAVILSFLILRFSPYHALKVFTARPNSITIYDRNGELLQVTAIDGIRRERSVLSAVPRDLQDVMIFAEDKRFYWHFGVDFAAILRAAYLNADNGRTVSGASTITMQLARIISGGIGREKNIAGKIHEAFDALRLEARFTKKEILEMYLNALPFGYRSEGVVSAARTIFSKEPDELSLTELYLLAVIPRRPAKYSPLADAEESAAAAYALYSRHKTKRNKQNPKLNLDDFAASARAARQFRYPFEAPHYIRYIAGQLPAGTAAAQLTLDLRVQQYAAHLIKSNVEKYRASRLTNGAALVIENATGSVLAWAGSADFHNEAAAGQIDGVLAPAQPGSSMKPFLYALALEKGLSPSSPLADVPRRYGSDEAYIPSNFNGRFNGPVLPRIALASSLNIPAVDILNKLGIETYAAKLRELKINAGTEDAGLGLALGNAPVSLFELTHAFSVFPNDGNLIENLKPYILADSYGKLPLEQNKLFSESAAPAAGRVFETDTARIIASFLSDKAARRLAFGESESFNTGFTSMWKTGTANQYQSIVALGATPLFTAAVWMGNFSGETVIGKTGSSAPAQTVRDILIFLQGKTDIPFQKPDGYELRPVCSLSGMTPSPYCVSIMREWVIKSVVQDAKEGSVCDWHKPSGVVYPPEYQSWFFSAARNGSLDYSGEALNLLSPRNGAVFYADSSGKALVPVEASGGAGSALSVEDNGRIWTENRPFRFTVEAERGGHALILRTDDEELEVLFIVK